MAYNSKRSGRRGTQIPIWDADVLVRRTWDTYDFAVFKVIWGLLGALASKWPLNQKPLTEERI